MNLLPSRGGILTAVGVRCFAFVGLLLVGTNVAHAQAISGGDDRYKTPQRFALELRFGPYKPNVDSEFSGTDARQPYADFFGSSRRLMSQLEFDYQPIQHIGSLGIGIGIGYFNETGHDLKADGSALPSADTSTLRLIPVSGSIVYRFDLPWERLHIPLVPYAKVGLDYVIWTVRDGNGEIPTGPSGAKGQGGTFGWHGVVGLSLVLNFLDPGAARQFDTEMGVNRTHVFAEFGHYDISGLGAKQKLHVGDDTWMAGMLFEF